MKTFFIKLVRLFPVLSGLLSIGCGLYCILWWEVPETFTFFQPDISIPCWLYCSTLNPVFVLSNFVISSLSIYAGIFQFFNRYSKKIICLVSITGILLFPVGILNFLSLTQRADKSNVNL